MFRYQHQKIEVISQGIHIGEYRRCQLAVDNIPCVPFDVHAADFLNFPSVDKRNEFLARQAMSLIETYGDARCPKPANLGEIAA